MAGRLRLWGKELPSGTVAILTTPEPLESWLKAEERVLARWLHQLGATAYRVRISGHIYPHQLPKLSAALKPRRIIPVHTRHPKLLQALAQHTA